MQEDASPRDIDRQTGLASIGTFMALEAEVDTRCRASVARAAAKLAKSSGRAQAIIAKQGWE